VELVASRRPVRPPLPLVAAVAALLLLAVGCRFFVYTSPFINPVDPGLQYAKEATIGALEYADGRGVRLPQDLDVLPDGSEVALVPSGFTGYGIVDLASGELTWGATGFSPWQVCVDASVPALYATSGGELFRVDTATGERTLLHGEYTQSGAVYYTRLAVAPGGDVAGLLYRYWWDDGGNYLTSAAIHILSPEGVLRLSVEIGVAGGTDVAVSDGDIYLSRDGIITVYDLETGIPYATISFDDASRQIVRRAYPDLPGYTFGAAYLSFDAATGYLACSSQWSDVTIPACYILDPAAASPLVDTLGSSADLPNALLAAGPDGTLYGMTNNGDFVEELASGTVVYENPSREAGEFRNITAAALGEGGLLYILDSQLLSVNAYDPASGSFAAVSLPRGADPGAAGWPTRLCASSTRLYLADGTTIRSYDLSGSFVEEWPLPDVASVVDLDLWSGQLLVVGVDFSSTAAVHLLADGNPVPTLISVSGLPLGAGQITGGATAVRADGSIVVAVSGSGVAYWGYMDVAGQSGSYRGVWDSATDPLLGSGTLDGSLYVIDGISEAPESVWISFPRIDAFVRFSTEGTVLGSFSRYVQKWTAGQIVNNGQSGGAFVVDSHARLWVQWGNEVWLVAPS
jgi:hypothetical protein